MAQFSVNTGQARGQADEEKRIADELGRMEDSIRGISNSLSFKIASKSRIQSRLRGTADRIGSSKRGMQGMHSALLNVIAGYEKTETRVCEHAGGITAYEIHDAGSPGQLEYETGEKSIGELDKFVESLISAGVYPQDVIKRLEDVRKYIGEIMDGDWEAVGALIAVPSLIKGDIDHWIDHMKNTLIDKTGFDVSARTEGALYTGQISSEHGSAGVTALAYEAYASAEGGMFTKGEDGNLLFNPHIDAKMGASATILTAEGTYAVGNKVLGADAGGHVTIGQVSGEVESTAGFRDSDGNIDPHAKMNASAEMILIDAEAQAGVTVLGTKAEVKGSVNVGMGAHANLEIGDGKIACDIGASLGIGASVSFSIDYGGTVDAIKDVANSALDIAKDAFHKLKFW